SSASSLTLESGLLSPAMQVGFFGDGTLSVQNGADVEAVFMTVGHHNGATGFLEIVGTDALGEGKSSRVNIPGNINAGRLFGSTGQIEIRDGGDMVVENQLWLGEFAGSTGTMLVTGGSTFQGDGPTGEFFVGFNGNGFLEVRDGSTVSGRVMEVAPNPGSLGTVLVGDGGTIALTSTFAVGRGGIATVEVEDGGQIIAPDIQIFNGGSLILPPPNPLTPDPITGGVRSGGLLSSGPIDGAGGREILIPGNLRPLGGEMGEPEQYGTIELSIATLGDATPPAPGTAGASNGPSFDTLRVVGDLAVGGSLVVKSPGKLIVPDLNNLPSLEIISAASVSGRGVFDEVQSLPNVEGPNGEQLYLLPRYTPTGVRLDVVSLTDIVNLPITDTTGVPGDPGAAVTTGDVDGDNRDDLVIAVQNGDLPGTVLVLASDGDGTFTLRPPLPSGGVRPRSVALGDFDDDGDLDIAVGNSGLAIDGEPPIIEDARVRFLRNDSESGFPPYGIDPLPAIPTIRVPDVQTGELRTGVPVDIVVGNFMSPFQINGNTNGLPTSRPAARTAARFAARALSRPGVAYVVSYGSGVAGTVAIATPTDGGGAGDDDWGPLCEEPSGPNPTSLAVFDPDGDGDMFADGLVVTERDDGTVRVLFNTDTVDGEFGVRTEVLDVGMNPVDVTVADLNVDGRAEIIVANGAGDGSLSIIETSEIDGDISFQPQISVPLSGQIPDETNEPRTLVAVPASDSSRVDIFAIALDEDGNTVIRVINNVGSLDDDNDSLIRLEGVQNFEDDAASQDEPALLASGDVDASRVDDLIVLRAPTPPAPGEPADSGEIETFRAPCDADFVDPIGAVSSGDITAFVEAFIAGFDENGFSAADIAPPPGGDGRLTSSDINRFVAVFLSGCP
ncbi:MAG: FG-GAP-like repeat-containing protein, partial [Planctomycetota bacterium]